MAKRFSKLQRALETLRTPTGEGVVPDAPAGTILANYQDYRKGAVVIKYPRSASSLPEELIVSTVLPFFYGGVATSGAIVKFSKRASEASAADGIQQSCNLLAVDPETHSYKRKFIPAKVTAFVGTGSETEETSKITGAKYSKRGGQSYTFPYGASVAEATESQVRKDILTGVGSAENISLSFRSEKN
jgi:hypothetical protein